MKKVTALFIFLIVQIDLYAQPKKTNNVGQETGTLLIPAADTATPAIKSAKPLCFNLFFFNHSVSLPFYHIVRTPFHPGVQAGIEGRYFERAAHKLFQTLNLGLFYNKYNGTSFFTNTEFGYRYTAPFRLSAEVMAGLGYIRTYHPATIYELNREGAYEKAKDKGFSSALYSFAVGIGYSWKTGSSFSVRPFVRYQFLLQSRYSKDLEVLPHAAFGAGARFSVNRKNK